MSIGLGLALVLSVSFICEFGAFVYFRRVIHWIVAFVVPAILSAGLYWLPNLSHFHDSELHQWFPIVFVLWFVPSVIAALFAGGVFPIIDKRKKLKPFGRGVRSDEPI